MSASVPPDHTLDSVLGLEVLEAGPERARAQFAVTDNARQIYGIVHGGAYAAAAESLASVATGVAVAEEGKRAMGQSNNASFVRPVSDGTIHVLASVRHSGRTTWVWDVDFTDDDGRLCALARVTVAVR